MKSVKYFLFSGIC